MVLKDLRGIVLASALGTAPLLSVGCEYPEIDSNSWEVQINGKTVDKVFSSDMERTRELAEKRGMSYAELARYDLDLWTNKNNNDNFFDLINLGISTDLANQYAGVGTNSWYTREGRYGRFTVADIVEFHKLRISPEMAHSYDSRFNSTDISMFQAGQVIMDSPVISPEIANAYDRRFNSFDLVKTAVISNLEPKEASAYHNMFSAINVIEMHLEDISPELAVQYDVSTHGSRGFGGQQVIKLHHTGIEPDLANRFMSLNKTYDARISTKDIINIINDGVSFEEVKRKARENWLSKKIIE